VGWPWTSVSMNLSTPYEVIREGNTPLAVLVGTVRNEATYGQMQLTKMFLGASLEAWILERWMQAALDGPSRNSGQSFDHDA
jgi:hypothetical protein